MTQVKVTRKKCKEWSKPKSNSFKMHGGYLTELYRISRDENLFLTFLTAWILLLYLPNCLVFVIYY
jgi:hypothetical protein